MKQEYFSKKKYFSIMLTVSGMMMIPDLASDLFLLNNFSKQEYFLMMITALVACWFC